MKVLRRSSGAVEAPVYDNETEGDLITIRMHHGWAFLRSPNTRYLGGGYDYFDYVDGKYFDEHSDLDEMLRAEAAAGEIRQDNVGDEEEDNELGEARGGSSSFGSMYMIFFMDLLMNLRGL
ncbi:hypothetical protein LIER_42009 [Lithospermum erythrorhizon]|uniref:Uncharacterized protein n=1 Tax=Lithospermum erythrorhizon TaxID=34254 RepID=A0AAV3RL11_LITER